MDLKSIVFKRMEFFVEYGTKSSLNLPKQLRDRLSKGGKLLPLGRPERGLSIKFIETKVTAIKPKGRQASLQACSDTSEVLTFD